MSTSPTPEHNVCETLNEVPMSPTPEHSLSEMWCLWGLRPSTYQEWGKTIEPLAQFSTVEQFWDVMDTYAMPSSLPASDRLALFKEGIAPDWEDERNRGGTTQVWFQEEDGQVSSSHDELWYEILMLLIGDQLDEETRKRINGVIFGHGKECASTKVEFWIDGLLQAPLSNLLSKMDHALVVPWCFWYLKGNATFKNWEDSIKKVVEFTTVEQFWDALDSLPPPSSLATNDRLALFKKGIPPLWENPQNAQGSTWHVMYKEVETEGPTSYDELWYEVSMLLMGNQLPIWTMKDINGVIFGRVKKINSHVKVDFWLRGAGQTHHCVRSTMNSICGNLRHPMPYLYFNHFPWKDKKAKAKKLYEAEASLPEAS